MSASTFSSFSARCPERTSGMPASSAVTHKNVAAALDGCKALGAGSAAVTYCNSTTCPRKAEWRRS